MAKIHTLKIKNYRGIKNFEHVFGETDFICLIGRGDSGKTTILQAINAVLTPNWNYSFNDTDFHNMKTENPIEIEVSLYDLPEKLLTDSKYGLYKRILNTKGDILDDLTQDDSEDTKDILTIKLIVRDDLEPKWYVSNKRDNQEDIEIRTGDRAKLNVFLVSDFIDRHFSWSKGNPLYSLLKQESIEDETDKIIAEAYRDAKDSINTDSFDSFDEILDKIKIAASKLGLSIEDAITSIDFRSTFIREGNIALHENNLPFRMKGKGTKRLLSIAIQLELAKKGGIILIDELEQGLEPNRAKFLSKKLKDNNSQQIFITTHSSNVLVELNTKNIFRICKNTDSLFTFDDSFQGCIRNNPDAFFAKRVIVCEGKTEVGICRALNNYLIATKDSINLELLGIALVDGTGSKLVEYSERFKKARFDVCMFCDSDDPPLNEKKQKLKEQNVLIVDCDEGNAIEQQLFNDLPWKKVKELLDYAIEKKSEQSILDSTGKKSIDEIKNEDNLAIRTLLGGKAKDIGWYKRIDHGEFIGKLWFGSLEELKGKTLKTQYDKLINWINE